MAKVTGVVEQFENPNRFGKVSVKVNGTYYSTKPEWWKGGTPAVGDTVEFDDGGAKYIKYFKILGSGGGAPAAASGGSKAPARTGGSGGRTFPVGETAPERTINRQNALTNAVAFLNGVGAGEAVTPDDVIELARLFEGYTTGSLDALEAELAQQAMTDGMSA